MVTSASEDAWIDDAIEELAQSGRLDDDVPWEDLYDSCRAGLWPSGRAEAFDRAWRECEEARILEAALEAPPTIVDQRMLAIIRPALPTRGPKSSRRSTIRGSSSVIWWAAAASLLVAAGSGALTLMGSDAPELLAEAPKGGRRVFRGGGGPEPVAEFLYTPRGRFALELSILDGGAPPHMRVFATVPGATPQLVDAAVESPVLGRMRVHFDIAAAAPSGPGAVRIYVVAARRAEVFAEFSAGVAAPSGSAIWKYDVEISDEPPPDRIRLGQPAKR